jgi:hypothetical protein
MVEPIQTGRGIRDEPRDHVDDRFERFYRDNFTQTARIASLLTNRPDRSANSSTASVQRSGLPRVRFRDLRHTHAFSSIVEPGVEVGLTTGDNRTDSHERAMYR